MTNRFLLICTTFLLVFSFESPGREAQSQEANGAPAKDLYGDDIPFGASVRLGSERFRMFNQWDKGIFFCNDNETIVTVGEARRISWWNARSGKLIERKMLHSYPNSFELSRDGTHLLLKSYRFVEPLRASQTVAEFWNLQTRQAAKQIAWDSDGHSAASVAVLPDDIHYITSSKNRIHIRNRLHESDIKEIVLPGRVRVENLAVSSDGELIAATSDKMVWLFDATTGEIEQTIESTERLLSMEFSPDGSRLALSVNTTRRNQYGVRVWDIGTQAFTHELRDPEFPGTYIREMVFSPDGKYLFGPNSELIHERDNNALLVWDLDRNELVHRLEASPGTRPRCVAVSPNGELVATVGDSEIAVWEVESGNRLGTEIKSHSQNVTGVRFIDDDSKIFTTSDDGTVRFWNTATGELLHIGGHERMIRGIAASPNGRWSASSSNDDTVRLWDAVDGTEKYWLKGHGGLGGRRAMAFTPDSQRFSSWGDDMFLRVWDVNTGKALVEEKLKPGGFDFDPTARNIGMGFRADGCFSRDASKLFLASGAQLYIYDGQTGKELSNISFGEPIDNLCSSFSNANVLMVRPAEESKEFPLKDGRVRMQGPKRHAISLYDLNEESDLWSFVISGLPGPMTISPDGKLVAASYRSESGDEIVFLDANTGKEITRVAKGCGLTFGSSGQPISFSNDGQRLAVAMHNSTVLVWELESLGIER